MPVRPEIAKDKSAIATLIARSYLEDGASTIEQTSVLRSLSSYNNDISLVSDGDGVVKAFSLYTPVTVAKKPGAVILAPLAIDTKDSAFDTVSFLEETFKKVTAQGSRYVFLMAELDDLSALGFVFAEDLDFTLAGNPPVSLLVKDLGVGDKLSGELDLPDILLV